jgi:ABC-type transporter Mla subunit MlaD
MAHDGSNSRGEAVQRLPLPRDGDRAEPKSAASGRGPVGGLSRLDLKTPPAGPVMAAPEPLPRFTPPKGVTKTAATPNSTPDIPLPNERTARTARPERPAGRPALKPAPKALPAPPAEKTADAKPADASPPADGDAAPAKAPPPRRRAAAPPRARVAANDDAPSIGGLIFALQQQPTNQPFVMAAAGSGGWLAVGSLLAWAMLAPEIARSGFFGALGSPTMIIVAATVLLPIALFWFLAMLAWRAQELKLMSAAMTEVAVRLAEPDRAAEQSAASLGQAVRRQVSFMNEAISRALGRAGELEGLVHNEVASLEKAYAENENKIRGLIQELAGERHALVSTTDKVSETLKSMGSEVPTLIEKLSQQQVKLAKIIEGAGQNLIALESQLSTASGGLEHTLANRTQQLQAVLDDYTVALDATLASRAEALDIQLLERTRALDAAFAERLEHFDDAMMRSSQAIDSAVNERARAITHAMEHHVRSLSDTLGQHASQLDESMMHGLDAVRRTSDSVTRQSLTAIEGLSGQADLLKRVSESLVSQMSGVASQGQTIAQAASMLETANLRIDSTLQKRHGELSETLQRLSGKADQIDQVMHTYSQTVQGTMADAEQRARSVTEQLAQEAVAHTQAAAAELERLRAQTDAQAARALDDMRAKVSGVSQEMQEMTQHVGSIRAEAERIPAAARQSADSMRNALNDQLRALEHLTSLSARERRDITPPDDPIMPSPQVPITAAFAAQRPDPNLSPSLPVPLNVNINVNDGGDRWSLGDLLARASREDSAINIANIARALDPTTAAAIWSRFRTGQRGIMVRSIYTNEGRPLFDETSSRYRSDMDFRRVVDRFLVDFEWLVRDIEQKDASGRSVQSHLISDSGRVYLFLAHASGRLR